MNKLNDALVMIFTWFLFSNYSLVLFCNNQGVRQYIKMFAVSYSKLFYIHFNFFLKLIIHPTFL